MIPALSQVCSLEASLERDVADYAAGACRAIELWLGKVETYLDAHSVADLRALLEENRVEAAVASYHGGLLDSQGDRRRESWEHFERRLALCQQLGVRTLVVAADLTAALDQQTIDRVTASLAQAAAKAAPHGVRLALEFQARNRFLNNLQTAAAVIVDLGSPHVGICLDAFHFYTGPSKTEDLAYLTPDNLFHVQLSDLPGVARELATDGDRVLPGDGDLPLDAIVEHLRAISYAGYVSVELMNPSLWRVPPRQFGEIAMTALRKSLRLASMD